MARPVKFRRVEHFPKEIYYVPWVKRMCKVEEVSLKVEELEAMRLKDIEDLSQEECAVRMNVSRQTFQNIIDSARKKTALALSGGKAIRIGGGNYTHKDCVYMCNECGESYEVNSEKDLVKCPKCGSPKTTCSTRTVDLCWKWCRKKENLAVEES